jgi:hypothetical protein
MYILLANKVNFAQRHCDVFPKNLAGFEPGSSLPEAIAMSTTPRRHQGCSGFIRNFVN